MGLLCYPFSLDWETFSGAKVNKKVFYAKKMWEYLFFFDMYNPQIQMFDGF